MSKNGKAATGVKTETQGDKGKAQLTPEDIERSFGRNAYHNIEILPDGTLREMIGHGDPRDEQVTRSLKTERTWY